MRPWQWGPAPTYRPPTLWANLRATAPLWGPLLLLALADCLGL